MWLEDLHAAKNTAGFRQPEAYAAHGSAGNDPCSTAYALERVSKLSALLLLLSLSALADPFCAAVFSAFQSAEPDVRRRLEARGVDVTQLPQREKFPEIRVEGFEAEKLKPWQRAQLEAQLKEAVGFMNDLYVASHGEPRNLTIRELVVMPWWKSGSWGTIRQRDERLVLGVMHVPGYGLVVRPKETLRAKYDDGKHLSRGTPLRKYWYFLNPVGEFRTQLRNSISKAAKFLSGRLESLGKSRDVASLSHGLKEAAQTLKLSEAEQAALTTAIAGRTPEELRDFVADWKSYVDDPSRIQIDVEPQTRDGNVKVRVWSLLAGYGNYHRVKVTVRTGDNDKLDQLRTTGDIDVQVTGALFAGYTIDDVDVHVQHADRGLGKSGLDYALSRLAPR